MPEKSEEEQNMPIDGIEDKGGDPVENVAELPEHK